jgi:cholestenol delta-isomerase
LLFLQQITWGPLSLLTTLFTARNNPREQGTRHLLQAVVCVGHLYGVALYYGTCGFAEHMRGISYSRPEVMYYWVYYAGMNAPWAVVPGCESPSVRFHSFSVVYLEVANGSVVVLLWRSWGAVRAAFGEAARGVEGRKRL